MLRLLVLFLIHISVASAHSSLNRCTADAVYYHRVMLECNLIHHIETDKNHAPVITSVHYGCVHSGCIVDPNLEYYDSVVAKEQWKCVSSKCSF